ncbi:MAG: zf-HC2 domain-containing protein [Spirochaetaceae bacterium]|nr:zf-HC2 domain-containing protein [Spirochaetaceae bacterium]
MCPDKQLLSAYCDGEVPSPWREKIQAHLEECGACRNAALRYGRLSKILRSGETPAPREAAFARVRERVLASPARRLSLWRKRVSLPLAAAAALVFFAGGMAVTLFTRELPEAASVAELRQRRAEDTANVQNIDELLKILAEGDSGGELTITLPQRNFHAHGKPAFFRAEDLARGKQ